MILASLRDPRSGAYVIQDLCESSVRLDRGRLRTAWQTLARRHASLRTCIRTEGTVAAHFADAPEYPWHEFEWRTCSSDEYQKKLDAFLNEDRELGFAFNDSVPMRFTLVRGPSADTLVWTCHHALLDGRSLVALWREWFAAYEECAFEHGAENFWSEHFRPITRTSGFLIDRLAPACATFKQTAALSAQTTEDLSRFAQAHGLTLNSLVLAAWALLLGRYSGERAVVFGVTRALPPAHQAPGFGINTVPFPVSMAADATLLTWLSQVRQLWLRMRAFADCALEDIRKWSGVSPDQPLFDHVLVYDHEAPGDALRRSGGSWDFRNVTRLQRTDVPLTVAVYGSPRLTFQLVCQAAPFSEAFVARMAVHFQTILESFVATPQCLLHEVRMLTEQEETWLTHGVNETPVHLQHDRSEHDLCAHQLIEQQVRKTPDAIALEDSSGSVSYRELDTAANRLASVLAARGFGVEDLAAVSIERSPQTVIAILAVLKTGGAFVAIDPTLPPARVQSMIEEARPKLVLRGAEETGHSATPRSEVVKTANLAYAVFTSGSTGRPKAVAVSHRALVNHTRAVAAAYEISPADRRLQFASMGSDVFVAEIFTYLSSGATLVFIPNHQRSTAQDFLRTLAERRITITGIPSSWFAECVNVLAAGSRSLPLSLRAVIVGMERIDPAALASWKGVAGNKIRCFNAYGPSEASPTSTIYEIGSSTWENGALVPIGKPIANTRAYLLNDDLHLVPVAVAGELYLGGMGVARGYLHAPQATEDRFLPDPFSPLPGARMYRTGDRAFRLPDGNLVFLGRLDRQVKIRGFRVELDEIEVVLNRHPAVHQAAVVFADAFTDRQRIIAYLSGRGLTLESLIPHLSETLPAYAHPAEFWLLETLPLTTSGKIDRAVLVKSPGTQLQPLTETPAVETGSSVAALWQKALRTSRVTTGNDFLRLAGDSLSATLLLTLIEKEFDVELRLADLLQATTIPDLTALVETRQLKHGRHAEAAR